jgi:hypothetical protein
MLVVLDFPDFSYNLKIFQTLIDYENMEKLSRRTIKNYNQWINSSMTIYKIMAIIIVDSLGMTIQCYRECIFP